MINRITKQNGAVLVMSLLMLFVLTLIGVSSMSTTTMQEKMSGNARNKHLAFQSAESGIREAELIIIDTINNPISQFTTVTKSNGLYPLGEGPTPVDAIDYDWWDNPLNGRIPSTDSNSDIATPPQYLIEYLGLTTQTEVTDIEIGIDGGAQGGIHTFRITSRGTGLTDNAVVVIQSNFGKRI